MTIALSLSTDHGDGWPFDGPGGILGHAFLPDSGNPGVVHFDRSEHWSTSHRGKDLMWGSARILWELGDWYEWLSLGLEYSKVGAGEDSGWPR